ncbi:hypothetical protein CHL78_012970 [Romboutsia weinsteinii]|uniref:HAD family hydrolase n=1 Tax=Romboutsia weinsteinii TaxID=2020949 RepID=A0A371J1B0_9FIRM|nr:hypothetical protein [Romboutsia weinsteinii]RDY26560.1 hypothetical protein CHL78_012970 [Romboutsia weinsteinii]
MIKGILFDWHGVLVVNDNRNHKKIDDIYAKLLQNTAIEQEIIELVMSYRKYDPLWELLPKLKENFRMCVVNNGPKATFDYWDKSNIQV